MGVVAVIALCLCGCSAKRSPEWFDIRKGLRPTVEGEINRQVRNDTLKVSYDLLVTNGNRCDSIVFQLRSKTDSGQSTCPLATSADSQLFTGSKRTMIPDSNGIFGTPKAKTRVKGTLTYPHARDYHADRYWMHLYWADPDSGKAQRTDMFPDSFSFFPNNAAGCSMEIGGMYYDDYGSPPYARGGYERPGWRTALRIDRSRKLWTGFAAFRIDHSQIFTLYDYAVVGGELYSAPRQARWLTVTLAAKYSRMKDEKDGVKFVKKGFGAETGLRYNGRFESFAYTYSSSVGGYHRFDASFAFGAAQGLSYGTKYSFSTGKYFRMYQISLFADMLENDGHSLWRIRNRPIYHVILAGVALIPLKLFVLHD